MNPNQQVSNHLPKTKPHLQPSKNQNKETPQVEDSYICTCGLQYKSFQALYLHNKLKHDLILKTHQKEKMERRTVWKGLRKIHVFQFPDRSDCEQGESNERMPPQNIENNNISNNSNRFLMRLAPLKEFIQSKEKSYEIIPGESFRKNGMSQYKEILQQLAMYLDSRFEPNTSQEQKTRQGSSKKYLNDLPLTFNAFVVEWAPHKQIRKYPQNQIQKVIQEFSSWLHVHKYSEYLAVPNSDC